MKGKSIFLDTFGDTPLLRVMEFFLTYPNFDYTKSFVAKETGISRVTIAKIWNGLIKKDMIASTRTMGNSQMYKLNVSNPKVTVLMKASTDLSLNYLQKLNGSKQVAVPA
jgi:hypothetical protein